MFYTESITIQYFEYNGMTYNLCSNLGQQNMLYYEHDILILLDFLKCLKLLQV